jgi:hypothetical protein
MQYIPRRRNLKILEQEMIESTMNIMAEVRGV